MDLLFKRSLRWGIIKFEIFLSSFRNANHTDENTAHAMQYSNCPIIAHKTDWSLILFDNKCTRRWSDQLYENPPCHFLVGKRGYIPGGYIDQTAWTTRHVVLEVEWCTLSPVRRLSNCWIYAVPYTYYRPILTQYIPASTAAILMQLGTVWPFLTTLVIGQGQMVLYIYCIII